MGISSGGEHLEDTVIDAEQGDIDDLAFAAFLVESVGDSGSGMLVDNAEDVETCDSSGVFSGLALSVVEVGGDDEDGVGNFPPETSFSSLDFVVVRTIAEIWRA